MEQQAAALPDGPGHHQGVPRHGAQGPPGIIIIIIIFFFLILSSLSSYHHHDHHHDLFEALVITRTILQDPGRGVR